MNMATVHVDNQAYEMDPKQNLLHGCLQLGMDLPYFCWHPAMGSVGACRQCAVKQFKDETDQHGKIVMACMTPAAEGTRISIRDPEAADFRKAIIEGYCDGVAIARPLIANNDLVRQFAQGADLPSSPCTYCNRCLVHAIKDPLGCYEVSRYNGDYEAMMRVVMSVYRPVHS